MNSLPYYPPLPLFIIMGSPVYELLVVRLSLPCRLDSESIKTYCKDIDLPTWRPSTCLLPIPLEFIAYWLLHYTLSERDSTGQPYPYLTAFTQQQRSAAQPLAEAWNQISRVRHLCMNPLLTTTMLFTWFYPLLTTAFTLGYGWSDALTHWWRIRHSVKSPVRWIPGVRYIQNMKDLVTKT